MKDKNPEQKTALAEEEKNGNSRAPKVVQQQTPDVIAESAEKQQSVHSFSINDFPRSP